MRHVSNGHQQALLLHEEDRFKTRDEALLRGGVRLRGGASQLARREILRMTAHIRAAQRECLLLVGLGAI